MPYYFFKGQYREILRVILSQHGLPYPEELVMVLAFLQATQLLFLFFPNKSFLLLHMDRVSMPHLQKFAHAKNSLCLLN